MALLKTKRTSLCVRRIFNIPKRVFLSFPKPTHRYRYQSLISISKCTFSTVTVPETTPVFDTKIHNLNKKNASLLSNSYEYDYFRSEISTRLISRILDLDGEYPIALNFGSHSGSLYKEMINFIRQNPDDKLPGGIKEIYEIDTCKEMLHRDVIPDWQQQLVKCNKVHIDNFDNIPLPFEDNTFDLVVSGMSIQWVNNIPFMFKELARIIKPDGCFIGGFCGGTTLQELRSALLLADQERKGGMNTHTSPSINISDIGSLLSRAGFVMITVDNEMIEIPYPNMFTLCSHLHGMGDQHAPKLPNDSGLRYQGISKDVFIAAAAIYDSMYSDSQTTNIGQETRSELHEYSNDDMSVDATVQMIFFMSWSPDPSQRKPMERGTAKFSMKDMDAITDMIEEEDPETDEPNEDGDKK